MDFENSDYDLYEYSEVQVTPQCKSHITVPKTIQQYNQRMQYNNTVSIFDNKDIEDSSNGLEVENQENDFFKDGGKLTYVVSGRGRGGRNVVIKPDHNTVNNDDEIRRHIRKLHGIGYANEITEETVKAHQMAKKLEKQEAVNKTSNSNSPIHLSGKTTPNKKCSDSSKNLNINKNSESSVESANVSEDVLFQNAEEHSEVSSKNSTFKVLENNDLPPTPTPPLSVLLRQAREDYKRTQIERKKALSSASQSQNCNSATQPKITTNFQQSPKESVIRKRSSSKSSNSSDSCKEEPLPWRQRNNSPPKYKWNVNGKNEIKKLDINSHDEFPVLK